MKTRTLRTARKSVHLKEDEHFHSGPPKEYHIIVNGRKKEVSTKTLSFDQIVALAFNPVPAGRTSCSRSPTGKARTRTPRGR